MFKIKKYFNRFECEETNNFLIYSNLFWIIRKIYEKNFKIKISIKIN